MRGDHDGRDVVALAAVVLVPGEEHGGPACLVLGARDDLGDQAGQVAVARSRAAAVRVVAQVGGDEGEAGGEVGRVAELHVLLATCSCQVRVVRGRVVLGRIEERSAAIARPGHRLLESPPAGSELGEDAGAADAVARRRGVVVDPVGGAGRHRQVVGEAGVGLGVECRGHPARAAERAHEPRARRTAHHVRVRLVLHHDPDDVVVALRGCFAGLPAGTDGGGGGCCVCLLRGGGGSAAAYGSNEGKACDGGSTHGPEGNRRPCDPSYRAAFWGSWPQKSARVSASSGPGRSRRSGGTAPYGSSSTCCRAYRATRAPEAQAHARTARPPRETGPACPHRSTPACADTKGARRAGRAAQSPALSRTSRPCESAPTQRSPASPFPPRRSVPATNARYKANRSRTSTCRRQQRATRPRRTCARPPVWPRAPRTRPSAQCAGRGRSCRLVRPASPPRELAAREPRARRTADSTRVSPAFPRASAATRAAGAQHCRREV